MRITDYPDLLRTKSKEPMPQAWDETNQDWTPAIDSAATLTQIKTALTDGTQKVALTGSLMEFYGATEAQRPAANSVPIGTVYMAVQTQQMWQSDGSQWVVM